MEKKSSLERNVAETCFLAQSFSFFLAQYLNDLSFFIKKISCYMHYNNKTTTGRDEWMNDDGDFFCLQDTRMKYSK